MATCGPKYGKEMNFDAAQLKQWTTQVFIKSGLYPDPADLAADVLVLTEARGYTAHGLTRVPSYVERLRSGIFNPRPKMQHRSMLGGIVLDADGAIGQVAATYATDLGLAGLEKSASVFVAIQSCGHLGALGIYALKAASAGAFCMVGQRTPPSLALAGFTGPAIGDNPVAFGCPCPTADPVIFDIACSVVAAGHIRMAAQESRSIPVNWAVDSAGNPTTDAERALQGALLPMGDYKGIGIAMMIECLAGAMAATSDFLKPRRDVLPRGGAPGRQGAFLWMVKPEAFSLRKDFDEYMLQWTNRYLAAGGSQARIPGRHAAHLERLSLAHGITLSKSVETELVQLGDRIGVPFGTW